MLNMKGMLNFPKKQKLVSSLQICEQINAVVYRHARVSRQNNQIPGFIAYDVAIVSDLKFLEH